jgi:hypothetical protein
MDSIAVCYVLLGSPCDRMAMRASINFMMYSGASSSER